MALRSSVNKKTNFNYCCPSKALTRVGGLGENLKMTPWCTVYVSLGSHNSPVTDSLGSCDTFTMQGVKFEFEHLSKNSK